MDSIPNGEPGPIMAGFFSVLGADWVAANTCLRQHLTNTVKGCGLPSSNEAERGMRLTFTSWEGGCGETGPTAPPQPRRDTAKKNAGRQRIGTLVKLLRPPSAVSHSMRQGIARAPPDRRIRGSDSGVVDTIRI